jgi:hypothetical protein
MKNKIKVKIKKFNNNNNFKNFIYIICRMKKKNYYNNYLNKKILYKISKNKMKIIKFIKIIIKFIN